MRKIGKMLPHSKELMTIQGPIDPLQEQTRQLLIQIIESLVPFKPQNKEISSLIEKLLIPLREIETHSMKKRGAFSRAVRIMTQSSAQVLSEGKKSEGIPVLKGRGEALTLLQKESPYSPINRPMEPFSPHLVRMALQTLSSLIRSELGKKAEDGERFEAIVHELIRSIEGQKEMGSSDQKSPPFHFAATLTNKEEKKEIPLPFSKERASPKTLSENRKISSAPSKEERNDSLNRISKEAPAVKFERMKTLESQEERPTKLSQPFQKSSENRKAPEIPERKEIPQILTREKEILSLNELKKEDRPPLKFKEQEGAKKEILQAMTQDLKTKETLKPSNSNNNLKINLLPEKITKKEPPILKETIAPEKPSNSIVREPESPKPAQNHELKKESLPALQETQSQPKTPVRHPIAFQLPNQPQFHSQRPPLLASSTQNIHPKSVPNPNVTIGPYVISPLSVFSSLKKKRKKEKDQSQKDPDPEKEWEAD